MYNLAHIHIYDDPIKQDINKSIDLLIKSLNAFRHSFFLLCIALVKKHGFDVEIIRQEIEMKTTKKSNLSAEVCSLIYFFQDYKSEYEKFYKLYQNMEWLYDEKCDPILLSDLGKQDESSIIPKYPNAKDITSEFYE